jgi:hypothetical protein
VDRTRRRDQLGEWGLASQEAARARLDDGEQVRLVIGVREHEHTAVGHSVAHREGRVDAIRVRQVKIDDRDVGSRALGFLYRLNTIPGERDHREVVLALEHSGDGVAEQRLPVGDQNADRVAAFRHPTCPDLGGARLGKPRCMRTPYAT